MERSYTVTEIDRMRKAVRSLMTYYYAWQDNGPDGKCRMATPPRNDADVEEQLRTYMLAGILVEDLEKRAEEHSK